MIMGTSEEFKDLLKSKIISTMKARNMSQTDLASLVGSERRVVNKQLNSEHTSIEKYLEFADALKIKIEINIQNDF